LKNPKVVSKRKAGKEVAKQAASQAAHKAALVEYPDLPGKKKES
jgi:hypothetical protein